MSYRWVRLDIGDIGDRRSNRKKKREAGVNEHVPKMSRFLLNGYKQEKIGGATVIFVIKIPDIREVSLRSGRNGVAWLRA